MIRYVYISFIITSIFIFYFQRVVIQRVLPHLCLEFSNHTMIPFVLPNVLLIAETCTNEEYNELIFPQLKPVLKIQDPIQVRKNTERNVLSKCFMRTTSCDL